MQIKRSIKTNQAALDAEETLAPQFSAATMRATCTGFTKQSTAKKELKQKQWQQPEQK